MRKRVKAIPHPLAEPRIPQIERLVLPSRHALIPRIVECQTGDLGSEAIRRSSCEVEGVLEDFGGFEAGLDTV